jgi:hypothetical protein
MKRDAVSLRPKRKPERLQIEFSRRKSSKDGICRINKPGSQSRKSDIQETAKPMANAYQVSTQALAVRLNTLGFV